MITLRKATGEDFDLAYQIKKASFRQYAEKIWGWDKTQQKQLHEKRFDERSFEVIQYNGNDIGVLCVIQEPDRLIVNQLFSLPEYQSKGIGKACMQMVIQRADKASLPIWLKVVRVNLRAIAFYRKLGFVETGETDTHKLFERVAQK